MTYRLKEVTIRTENTPAGMQQIGELWHDITNGIIPVWFDSAHSLQQDLFPIAKYSHYEHEEKGSYDFTIAGVTEQFLQQLETQVKRGQYKKYLASDAAGDVAACTRTVWGQVWADQKAGMIQRAFAADYESSIPSAFTKDGKAYCTLYITVEACDDPVK